MDPAEVVAAAFEAVRADDLDAALALFSEDCVIALPGETYEGPDGVRAWRASREAGSGPKLSAGEPEMVDSTHVLVPLMVEVAIGGTTETVKATGVWTVIYGLVTEVRAVPGGRRMAIASLSPGE
jgi:ketosteroid isomerase-like protein